MSKQKDIRKLVMEFEYGDRASLTRDELLTLATYLMNSKKQMSSDSLKALEVIKGVPCQRYVVSDIIDKPGSKMLTLYYEVSATFVKDELAKYDFHTLTRREN